MQDRGDCRKRSQEHYLVRAGQLRIAATLSSDPTAKNTLFDLAEQYEKMALSRGAEGVRRGA